MNAITYISPALADEEFIRLFGDTNDTLLREACRRLHDALVAREEDADEARERLEEAEGADVSHRVMALREVMGTVAEYIARQRESKEKRHVIKLITSVMENTK